MPDEPAAGQPTAGQLTPQQSTSGRSSTGEPTPAPQQSTGAASDGQALHGGHGTSMAAWVVTGGVLLGTLLICIAMIFVWVPVIIIGVVVIVASAVAGPVLVRAGYGENVPNREYTGGPRAVR